MRFFIPVLVVIFCSHYVLAQNIGRFKITSSVQAGGGTTFSTSNRFQLSSTVAQPLAAPPGNSRFSIQGGFWVWEAPIIFAPSKGGDIFSLSFNTELGQGYVVEYTDSLLKPEWHILQSKLGCQRSVKTSHSEVRGS